MTVLEVAYNAACDIDAGDANIGEVVDHVAHMYTLSEQETADLFDALTDLAADSA
jgi:hypothetical protein